MIRVLQVFDSLEISGGVQAVIMNAYRAIDKTKIQFDFAHYHDPDASNSYRQEIEALGGRVIKIKCLSEAGIKGFYDQFVRLFSENHYDAVHAHNIHHNGIILSAAKRCGIANRISHSHQAFDEYNDKSYRRLIAKLLMRLNLRVATQKVACSDLAAEFLYGKGYPYTFIPNAIDITKYQSLPAKDVLREQYGIKRDRKLLVHIGRMAPQKNHFFILDIMERLKDTDCVLWLIGDGQLKDEILAQIEARGLSGQIQYLGIRSDCPQILKAADIMILPSVYEGLPVVAVEAQAAGCYSLISDVVTKQADLGVGSVKYLPIDNADLWADTIISFSPSAHSDEASDNSVRNIKKRGFSTAENVDKWCALYCKDR